MCSTDVAKRGPEIGGITKIFLFTTAMHSHSARARRRNPTKPSAPLALSGVYLVVVVRLATVT